MAGISRAARAALMTAVDPARSPGDAAAAVARGASPDSPLLAQTPGYVEGPRRPMPPNGMSPACPKARRNPPMENADRTITSLASRART